MDTATPSPILSRTSRELFQSRCGRWRVLQGRELFVGFRRVLMVGLMFSEVIAVGWCPKMYADKRRANKKQRRHGIFEVWKLKIPFAVPVAVGRI